MLDLPRYRLEKTRIHFSNRCCCAALHSQKSLLISAGGIPTNIGYCENFPYFGGRKEVLPFGGRPFAPSNHLFSSSHYYALKSGKKDEVPDGLAGEFNSKLEKLFGPSKFAYDYNKIVYSGALCSSRGPETNSAYGSRRRASRSTQCSTLRPSRRVGRSSAGRARLTASS